MHALKDLFTTDVGIMSLVGLVVMLGGGMAFVRYLFRHMALDAAQAARAQQAPR